MYKRKKSGYYYSDDYGNTYVDFDLFTYESYTANDKYSDLGMGWEFDFPYIEYCGDYRYLHFGARGIWRIYNEKNLEGCPNDITMVSATQVKEKDGKIYDFGSKGQLTSIEDRFGNKIRFNYNETGRAVKKGPDYATEYYPRLTSIIDSVGRSITFTYTNDTVTVSYNGRTITYTKEYLSGYTGNNAVFNGKYCLESITNAENLTTNYKYRFDVFRAGFGFKKFMYDWHPYYKEYIYVGYAMLTNVTDPTKNGISFDYYSKVKNNGRYGIMEFPKVIEFFDGRTSWNYRYDANNFFGNNVEYDGYPFFHSESDIARKLYSPLESIPFFNYRSTVYFKEGEQYKSVNYNYSYSFRFSLPQMFLTIKSELACLLEPESDTVKKLEYKKINYYEYDENGYLAEDSCRVYSSAYNHYALIKNTYMHNWHGELIEFTPYDSHYNDCYINAGKKVYIKYDPTYHFITQKDYEQTHEKKIKEVYTPSDDGKSIFRAEVYQNDVLKRRIEFDHDSYGNIIRKKRYKENEGEWTIESIVNFKYNNGADVNRIWIESVKDVDGVDISSYSGGTSGTIDRNYTYDWYGNLLTETDGVGNLYEYKYDKLNRITDLINPDKSSKAVLYVVNPEDNYVEVTNEIGNKMRYTYNNDLLIEEKNITTGDVINSYEYNHLGLQSKIINHSNKGNATTTLFEYDSYGNIKAKRVYNEDYEKEYEEIYSYEYAANVDYPRTVVAITKTINGEEGAPTISEVSHYDQYGNVIVTFRLKGTEMYLFEAYGYDCLNNMTNKSIGLYSSTEYKEATTRYEYTFDNKLEKIYNEDKKESRYVYDSLGHVVEEHDFNDNVTSYRYDILGRMIEQTTPYDGVNKGSSKHYYSANNNLIKQMTKNTLPGTIADYSTLEYDYNYRNQVVKSKAHDGIMPNYTQYYYDAAGNMRRMYTGLIQPLTITGLDAVSGGSMGYATTKYHYDSYNRLTGMTDPMDQDEVYDYDIKGTMTEKIDRNKVSTSYQYDAMNRIINQTAGNMVASYDYYITGALKSMSSPEYSSSYEYDTLGRLVKESDSAGIERIYGYDYRDNRNSFSLCVNGVIQIHQTYDYNNRSLLESVSENDSLITTYGYDDNGNLTSKVNSNETRTDYTYFDSNQVKTLTNKQGQVAKSSYEYSYYLNGNMYTETSGQGATKKYFYDGMGRLKEEEAGGTNYIYTYDLLGNREGMVKSGLSPSTTSYSYNKNNQLMSEETTEGNITDISLYGYDDNGNMLYKMLGKIEPAIGGEESLGLSVLEDGQDSGVWAYSYDGFNRLTKVQNGGNISTYTYDGNGLRQSKTVNNVTTNHIWDGSNMVAETNSAGNITSKYYRGNGLISQDIGGTLSYYQFNGHGDVVSMTNASGNTIWDYGYDAFGNQGENLPQNKDKVEPENPFRYAGEYTDLSSGLIYLRNRYYDPSVGRFLTEDPIRSGSNWYIYANNNPIMFVDPLGLSAGVNFGPNEGADWLRTGSGKSFEEFWGISPLGSSAGQISSQSGYGGIYDTFSYVNDKYGSGWTASSWGTLEPNVPNFLMNDLEYGVGNCTLTGITRLFAYQRDNNGYTGIPDNATLYGDIKAIAEGYGYNSDDGTFPTKINNIINDTLAKYNISGKGRSIYVWSFNTVKTEIDAGRPLLFNVAFGYYSDHTITVVGYSEFTRNWYDGTKQFLKVYDGWTKSNQYIDYNEYNSLLSSGVFGSFSTAKFN